MRKLKLDIDELQVDSFAIPTWTLSGTVDAQRFDPLYPEVPNESLDACYPGTTDNGGVNTVGTCIGPTYCCELTWKASCNTCGTCAPSCNGTCYQTCQAGISCTDACTNCSI